MTTISQLIKQKVRLKKKRNQKTPILGNNPQRKATCVRIFIMTPRKPNSAKRKVAKIRINRLKPTFAYIPGEGHNLREYSVVSVRGGNVKDLPGIKYKLVRGVYDFEGVKGRITSRSKYGVGKK